MLNFYKRLLFAWIEVFLQKLIAPQTTDNGFLYSRNDNILPS